MMMDEISEYGFWVNELARNINDERRFINNAGVLPIVTSVQDLLNWISDKRQYSRMHRDAWLSAISDFECSVDALGPTLTKVLSRRGRNLLITLRSLPLSHESQMRTSNAISIRKKALRQAKKLLVTLKEERILLGAWVDVVGTTRNIALPPTRLEVHRDVLIDVAHCQNKNMGTFGVRRNISELLRLSVEHLEHNDIYSKSKYPKLGIHTLTIEERIDLCRQALLYNEEKRDRIVWLEISRAGMHKMSMDCGDVIFFNGQWLMGQKDANISKNIESLPSEVQKNLERFGKYQFSGDKHTVLARIALEDGFISTADDEARKILQGLFDLGYVNRGKDWSINDGFVVYSGDRDVMSSTSRKREIEGMYNPYTDSISEQIESNDLNTSSVNSKNLDERLSLLLELIEELRSANGKSSEIKLLASTRLLEHVTSWCDDTKRWYEFTEQYVKLAWARKRELSYLDELVQPILLTGIQINGAEHEGLKAIRKKAIINMRRTGYSFHRGKAISNLRAISKINDITKSSRSFDWLVQTYSSGTSLHSSLLNHEKQFENELARLVRYRNALEHGGPRHLLVADSSADFAAQVAFLAASTAMDSFLNGKNLEAAFDRENKVFSRKFRQLAGGGQAIRILGNR